MMMSPLKVLSNTVITDAGVFIYTSADVCLDLSGLMFVVLSARNRGIRWKHTIKNAAPDRTQTIAVIRVSSRTL